MTTLDDYDIHGIDRYLTDGYPWVAWDRMREDDPCYWYERDGIAPFWAITRHSDVKAIGADSTRFINGGGRLRLTDLAMEERMERGRRRKIEDRGWDPTEPEDMVFLDAPRHTDMRMLTARHFTPARCRAMADTLQADAERFTAQLADRLEAGEIVDLVHDYAVALPLTTICTMMGLDPADWEDIHRWTDSLFDYNSMRFALPGEDRYEMRKRLHREYHDYKTELVARKRRDPGDDLSSILVHAEIDGRPLTEQQLHGYLNLLIAAGNETTRNALSRGMLALAENPDQVDRLLDDPDRFVDSAVEEIVRWTTPVIQFVRTATTDVELHGKQIAEGDHVALWYGPANRDPRVFDEPYRLDISRQPNEHLGFGHGSHFCLGANVARWELRAALRALAATDVLRRLQPAEAPTWLTDLHVGAYNYAPVNYR